MRWFFGVISGLFAWLTGRQKEHEREMHRQAGRHDAQLEQAEEAESVREAMDGVEELGDEAVQGRLRKGEF